MQAEIRSLQDASHYPPSNSDRVCKHHLETIKMLITKIKFQFRKFHCYVSSY